MYKVIVNNGYRKIDMEYNSIGFDFETLTEAMSFIEIVFKHTNSCGVEIFCFEESGD